jgi:hypothetical protein
MEGLFSIANTSVLPCWLLLIAAPRWIWTQRVCFWAMPVLLGSLYLYLLSGGLGDGGFDSLAAVMRLFQTPRAVFAGWVHYLAFDLFIGAWETRDSAAAGIPRWALLPCQLLTFLLGPLGLLLYLLLRGAWKGKWEPGL